MQQLKMTCNLFVTGNAGAMRRIRHLSHMIIVFVGYIYIYIYIYIFPPSSDDIDRTATAVVSLSGTSLLDT